jgi:hypothetical protein
MMKEPLDDQNGAAEWSFFLAWSLKTKMGRLMVVILLMTVTGTGSSDLGPPAQTRAW